MHRDGWSSKADRRSVLAYNGEFFPITNAPCLRCIVENASPFSIVFSQLETEWLTISISFVPFFLPLRLVSFVSFFFFFIILVEDFILFFTESMTISRDNGSNLWMRGSFRNLKLDREDQSMIQSEITSCIDSYRCWLIVWGWVLLIV